jgi:radical SAM family RiPP maturation amino acid epimerase
MFFHYPMMPGQIVAWGQRQLRNGGKMDIFTVLKGSRNPQIASVKRFLERLWADKNLSEKLKSNPQEIISNYDLKVDPEELRFLWDEEYRKNLEGQYGLRASDGQSALVKDYLAFKNIKLTYADNIRKESTPLDQSFKDWRERQISRCQTEFEANYNEAIAHLVFGIELGKGCSGGCAFCGLNAQKLSTNFSYTPENAKLWNETLNVLKKFAGEIAGRWGFLYWATDPFDNPDYEKFCMDFFDTFGVFPHTTTTQALKNPDRTHKFIELAQKSGCFHNRFSILSLEMLNKVYTEFSEEELFFVELVMQNKESLATKVISGRAKNKNNNFMTGQTIACLSGFLLNMVERTIKLISPCSPSERWPLGYYVFAQADFTDAENLEKVIKDMINNNMSALMPPKIKLSFRKDLDYQNLIDGFIVSTENGSQEFRGTHYLADLGEIIYIGKQSSEEIVQHFSNNSIPQDISLGWLKLLYDNGILNEDPALLGGKYE